MKAGSKCERKGDQLQAFEVYIDNDDTLSFLLKQKDDASHRKPYPHSLSRKS